MYFGYSECTPTKAMPASPLELVLGMADTAGIDTVDKGFFNCKQRERIDVICYVACNTDMFQNTILRLCHFFMEVVSFFSQMASSSA